MMTDSLERSFDHGRVPAVGILLTNVGTPDAATTPALRRYLREFLSDPRVIEDQGLKWKLILNGIILRTRPAKSARGYRHVWWDEGSPLLVISKRQAEGLRDRMAGRFGNPVLVEIGMGYGSPSIPSGLAKLRDAGCDRILVLPLFPQYAAATVGSTFDAVSSCLQTWRWVPQLRFLSGYHDDPGYIRALAGSIRDYRESNSAGQRLLISFHGLPVRALHQGDPYHCHCHATARLLWSELGTPEADQHMSFQSRFGKEVWLQPYTGDMLRDWGRAGVKTADVICPGFSADCLETIEEIGDEYAEIFKTAGGEKLNYIPALNERPDHLDALAGILARNLSGWGIPTDQWNEEQARTSALAREKRAQEVKDSGVNA
jgi:ferrochelatase